MKNLLEKVDMYYNLATASDRKSIFNKLSATPSSSEIVAAIGDFFTQAESYLDASLEAEISSLKNASAQNNYDNLKKNIQTIAAVMSDKTGPAYTSAVTLLTKVNRVIRSQASKGN